MRPVSAEELCLFRQTMQQRDAQSHLALEQRFRDAQQIITAATQLLKQDFSAGQVILFGSALNQDCFHLNSDIDLAAAGLAPLDYFTAVARLQDLSSFKIDLVRLESCHPSLRDTILERGRKL